MRPLTKSQRRVLGLAVSQGFVGQYPLVVTVQTLRSLERLGLIRERHDPATYRTYYEPTEAGRAEMRPPEPKADDAEAQIRRDLGAILHQAGRQLGMSDQYRDRW